MSPPVEPPPTIQRSIHHHPKPTLILLLVLLGIPLLGTFSFFIFKASSDRKVVWLTQAEFRRSVQPGTLTRLKYTIINWTGPLLRGFIRIRPQINIDASLIAL